jgi:hypothetical protein
MHLARIGGDDVAGERFDASPTAPGPLRTTVHQSKAKRGMSMPFIGAHAFYLGAEHTGKGGCENSA